jgi:hypothetical protein
MAVIGGPVAVTLAEHALDSSRTTIYRDCAFSGQTSPKIEVAEARNAGRYDFVNCDLQPSDFHITSAVAGMRIRVQRPDRTAFQIDATGTVTAIPRFDPPDTPPSVTLTGPASGSTFTAGASITLTAQASDPDGAVRQVEFFAGSLSLGVATAGPYSVTWPNAPSGTYAITAVATDDEGVTTQSAAVGIVVSDP